MKRLLTGLGFTLLMLNLLFPRAQAQEAPLFIIAHTPAHTEFAAELQRELQQALPNHKLVAREIPLQRLDRHTVIITLGKSTLLHVLDSPQHRHNAVLAALISSRDYYRTVKHAAAGRPGNPREGPVSALFSDPSPLLQINLGALLLDKPVIAFVYDEHDQRLIDPIRGRATALGLPEPVFVPLDTGDIHQTLKNRRMATADLLLATPNRQLYSSHNAKSIIFSLLERKQALLGYSTGWVQSGALATVYSSRQEVTQSLTALLRKIAGNSGRLPAPAHPEHFDVEINRNIAELLGIAITDAGKIAGQLRKEISPHVQ